MDLITTRLWNQPVVGGVGTLYSSAADCLAKTGGWRWWGRRWVEASGGPPRAVHAPACYTHAGCQQDATPPPSHLPTVRAEGVSALYKGCTAHFLRVGPHTIVTLLLLERMQALLGVAQPGAGQVAPATQGKHNTI